MTPTTTSAMTPATDNTIIGQMNTGTGGVSVEAGLKMYNTQQYTTQQYTTQQYTTQQYTTQQYTTQQYTTQQHTTQQYTIQQYTTQQYNTQQYTTQQYTTQQYTTQQYTIQQYTTQQHTVHTLMYYGVYLTYIVLLLRCSWCLPDGHKLEDLLSTHKGPLSREMEHHVGWGRSCCSTPISSNHYHRIYS